MVDYGDAPFLWIVDSPNQAGIGPNLCNGAYWDESHPLSKELWSRFSDWAIEFESAWSCLDNFGLETSEPINWDWDLFNARGLELARLLKQEVGSTYRVIYFKQSEDPNNEVDKRTEILFDGSLSVLPLVINHESGPLRLCKHIISGGKTGVDR